MGARELRPCRAPLGRGGSATVDWAGNPGSGRLSGGLSQSTSAIVEPAGTVTVRVRGCDAPVDADASDEVDTAFYTRAD